MRVLETLDVSCGKNFVLLIVNITNNFVRRSREELERKTTENASRPLSVQMNNCGGGFRRKKYSQSNNNSHCLHLIEWPWRCLTRKDEKGKTTLQIFTKKSLSIIFLLFASYFFSDYQHSCLISLNMIYTLESLLRHNKQQSFQVDDRFLTPCLVTSIPCKLHFPCSRF